MIRIRHYMCSTEEHPTLQIDIINVDRMTYLLKVLNLAIHQNATETVINWQSHINFIIRKDNTLGFGLKQYIRTRPNVHIHIPAIRLEWDTYATDAEIEWEDLIELNRGEDSLFNLVKTNIANGEYA